MSRTSGLPGEVSNVDVFEEGRVGALVVELRTAEKKAKKASRPRIGIAKNASRPKILRGSS